MKTGRIIIASLCLLLIPFSAKPQIKRLGEDVRYGASLRGTFGSGDNAPFWFSNNRYGLGAIGDNTVMARAYIKRDVETDSLRNWRIGYGADLVASSQSSRRLPTCNGRCSVFRLDRRRDPRN